MARYTGADCRLCRREGIKLFLKGDRCYTDKCGVERRPTPPGQPPKRRPKESSYRVRTGDVISVAEKAKDMTAIKSAIISSGRIEVPAWLEVDVDRKQGKILSLPVREQIDAPVREQLIVELYSK